MQSRFPIPTQHHRLFAQASDRRHHPMPLPSSWPREMASVGNSNDSFGGPGAPFPAPNTLATYPTYDSGYGQRLCPQIQVLQGHDRALAWKHNVVQGSTWNLPDDAQHFESRQPGATQMATPDITSTHVGFKTEIAGYPIQQQQQSPTQGYSNSAMGNTGDVLVLTSVSQASPGAVIDATDDGSSSEKALRDDTWGFGAVFLDIHNGSLEIALQALVDFTGRLESEAAQLPAGSDCDKLGGGRIEFWNNFNNAWLAFCLKQKEVVDSFQQLSTTQALETKATISNTAKVLVALCDKLERHGLVDYEYGILEEQIIAALEDCLDSCQKKQAGADMVEFRREAFPSDPVQISDLAS